MALSTQTIEALAVELDNAERVRQPVEHFSRRYAEMTVDDGYAIQKAWVALKCAAGRKVVGH